MRRNRIYPGQWFVTVLILTIGLSSYGCGDTVSVSADVQVPLSSLTVTPGTLQPAFSSNTTNYTVDAPTSADKVTVTAIPKDNTAIVTINNAVTTQLPVPLGAPGSTTIITIVLEALNGAESTYTVNVTRLLSSDNNLSVLTVTANNIVQPLAPDFDASILDYTVNVANTVGQVTVAATKSDLNAVMLIGFVTVPAGTASGSAPNIPLGGPGTATPISITMTAPDGSPKTYTVTVNRAASSDDTLSALTVTANNVVQPLAPDFNASTLGYTVNVANTVDQVTVAATKSDLNAVMQIGSVTVPGGTASGSAPNIPLGGPGTPTVVSIFVTAQSGGAPKTYTVTVNRAASSDDTLSALTVTANNVVQPLAPDFNASTLGYTVNVVNTVDQVTVAATKSDLNAVMQIGSVTVPGGTASGSAPNIPLGGPGTPTVVSIFVTAQSGGVPKTYTITVNRAAPASDNNLSALTITGGSLVPDFASSTTTYTVDVPNSVESVTISATKSDQNAVMTGGVTAGTGVATGQATIQLPIPLIPIPVSITVIAPNGDPKTYTIIITRALS